MNYEVQVEDLPTREYSILQDFIKKYPKSKVYRLELNNNWRPENFYIRKYVKKDTVNLRYIKLPVDTDKIPVYEIAKPLKDKITEAGLKFKLPNKDKRLLSKILPVNVDMSHLTPAEMSDLLNEILQKESDVKKKAETNKKMQDEMNEQMEDFEKEKLAFEEDKQSLQKEYRKILDKEDELNHLTANVENMQLSQEH